LSFLIRLAVITSTISFIDTIFNSLASQYWWKVIFFLIILDSLQNIARDMNFMRTIFKNFVEDTELENSKGNLRYNTILDLLDKIDAAITSLVKRIIYLTNISKFNQYIFEMNRKKEKGNELESDASSIAEQYQAMSPNSKSEVKTFFFERAQSYPQPVKNKNQEEEEEEEPFDKQKFNFIIQEIRELFFNPTTEKKLNAILSRLKHALKSHCDSPSPLPISTPVPEPKTQHLNQEEVIELARRALRKESRSMRMKMLGAESNSSVF